MAKSPKPGRSPVTPTSVESAPADAGSRSAAAETAPTPSRASGIQFGPTPSPPGSRLKRPNR